MDEQQKAAELAVIATKREKWGNLGAAVHNTEMALQARAQQLKIKLGTPPLVPADLPAAEETLKDVKKQIAALVEDRKALTGKIDAVVQRLMQPEKDALLAVGPFEAAIIKVKKAKQKEDDDNRLKLEEIKGIAEKVRVYVAQKNAEWLKAQNDLIANSYEAALKGTPKIPQGVPPENIAAFVTQIKGRVTIANRTMEKPTLAPVLATQEEINAAIDQAFSPTPAQDYVDGFAADVDLKYADYELAWQNKEQALELTKQEASENLLAIDKQQSAQIATAAFASFATPSVSADTKPLKEVYRLDMPETLESDKVIIKAYMTNTEKCDPYLSLTKWFNLSVTQMIKALEKVKSEDNKFDVSGLKWKVEDKL